VFATVISEHIFRRRPARELLRQLPILILPSMLMFAVQLWIVWGGPQITGGNLHWTKTNLIRGIRNAIYAYYRGGETWISWWGTFGWGDAYLVIISPAFQARLWKVLVALSLLMFLMVFFRALNVSRLFFEMVGRGRWRRALRVLFANPLITNHLLFSAFMILLYAVSDNSFFAQGRHWFPYTLSGFLITLYYGPRAFRRKDTSSSLSTTIMVGLLIYCAVASYYSLKTITERYY
jgi:hypothetical protein